MSSTLLICNRTRSEIDIKLVGRVASFFLKKHGLGSKYLSIAFIGDIAIKKINQKYRGKNKPTDVLSFRDDGDSFGEILIDFAQIKRQSNKNSKSVNDELVFVLVHGLLHLLGFDDKTAKQALVMERLGNEFISELTRKKII
ncbi:rRNA maturation RNase YbeY [Patescibacteria group bacterium]|nr:rRNA maturation RNase YbeY [Patescibacteria group bacterium]